jgi:hypothetical protein
MNHKKLRRLYREEWLQVPQASARYTGADDSPARSHPTSAGAWTSSQMPSPMAAGSGYWRLSTTSPVNA